MKSKLIPALLIGLTCAAFAQKTTLIGPGLRNGDFNEDTDPTDQRTFADTPFWENIAGPQTGISARTNLTNLSGSRNAQVSQAPNHLSAQSTGHILAEGDSFSVSYEWRDAFQWIDATDKVNIILFVTTDDLISSERTIIGSTASPLSTLDNTYEPVIANDFFIADDTYVGKTVFVGIDTLSPGTSGFCRLDDFQLSVGAPESDPILRHELGDLVFGDLVHPTSVSSTSKTVSFRNLGANNNLGIISVTLSPESSDVFSITRPRVADPASSPTAPSTSKSPPPEAASSPPTPVNSSSAPSPRIKASPSPSPPPSPTARNSSPPAPPSSSTTTTDSPMASTTPPFATADSRKAPQDKPSSKLQCG